MSDFEVSVSNSGDDEKCSSCSGVIPAHQQHVIEEKVIVESRSYEIYNYHMSCYYDKMENKK